MSNHYHHNKRKIINDPVHGFISIRSELIYDLISDPFFQRLRRIRQLGMTHFVYPGATHSRFQHAIGTMHLMEMAIGVIRSKKHEITGPEEEAVLIAALLHDIGHGPFSHTLESSIIPDMPHEEMSNILMNELNKKFRGKLSLAIEIFRNRYKKKFLHQLVAGQLDMDRMDYLKRDSFYTGVTEGVIGSDRIIKMLNVVDDQLVVEAKGIYSVEKFLIARRLMYWQVYFHKTVVSAENLLTMLLRRAREIVLTGEELFGSPYLLYFLKERAEAVDKESNQVFKVKKETINNFINLDDDDILSAAKVWVKHSDRTLSLLARWFTERHLFRIVFQDMAFGKERIDILKEKLKLEYDIPGDESSYFVISGSISNYAYTSEDERIKILYKDGNIADISDASDMLDISVLSKTVKKYFLCYPKKLENFHDTKSRKKL